MKLTIERTAFLKALSHCQNVVERKTTLPILAHILLEADGVSVKLTATDLELSIIEKVEAVVMEPGRAAVPAHLLYDIVRKLPEGSKLELIINLENGQLQISSGKSQFHLPCVPSEDFPQIDTGKQLHHFVLKSNVLRDLIEKTKFAISTENTRYFLNGIYLHIVDDKELVAVATDAHRLAKVSVPAPEGAKGMPGIIISRKTVNELSLLIANDHNDVAIGVSENQISCTIGSAYLVSRLVDGQYPDYSTAIPVANDRKVKLAVKSFAKAVDRVATMSTDRLAGIYIDLDKGRLALSAIGENAGAAHEEIEIDYSSDKVNIGLSARYIMDVTQQIKGDDAVLLFGDGDTPLIVKAAQDDNALYVIMPMRV